jgi:hypothetical protein
LLKLSDYKAAETVASDLIKLEPFSSSGYYLRGFALERGGPPKKAIDDYITANELFSNKDKMPSVGYFGIARSYARLGILRRHNVHRDLGVIKSSSQRHRPDPGDDCRLHR